MAKIFLFKGKKFDEIKVMSLDEFSKILPSKERRKIKRGFTESEKKLLNNIRSNKDKDKMLRTKCRDMIVLPEMVDKKLGIYDGQEFKSVIIMQEMIGKRLGELSPTRRKVMHGSPGFGATRSSKFVPLK